MSQLKKNPSLEMPVGQLIKKASLTTLEKGQMSNVVSLECIIGLFKQE